jgi:hypothetical protein
MDAALLKPDRLIEIDDRYEKEIALKAVILTSDPAYYRRTLPETDRLQWEAVSLILENLARYYPDRFSMRVSGSRTEWRNRLSGAATSFTKGDSSTLPFAPLDWIGRQVQEDLLLLEENPDGEIVLVAGQLCFGAAWSLEEKIGRSFSAIHQPVPCFEERIARPGEAMLRRLKPGRPAYRINWSISASDRLNLAPREASEWLPRRREITPENAGRLCRLRLERQTFSRLPETQGILFTIKTYLHPIEEIAEDPEKRLRLIDHLKTMPEERIAYKGLDEYLEPLLLYLESRNE